MFISFFMYLRVKGVFTNVIYNHIKVKFIWHAALALKSHSYKIVLLITLNQKSHIVGPLELTFYPQSGKYNCLKLKSYVKELSLL